MLPPLNYSRTSHCRFKQAAILFIISTALTAIQLRVAQAADGFSNIGLVSDDYPGISANGAAIVGQRDNGSYYEAFRKVEGGALIDLGRLPSASSGDSLAKASNIDGTVIVGQSFNGTYNEAFRWTATGMVGLGRLNNASSGESIANAVSANGNVVVGESYNGGYNEAFRWTSIGMEGLGRLTTSGESRAYAVSGNGNVVVGVSTNASGLMEAFLWSTSSNTMTGLGTINNATGHSYAFGTNADGSVVVGQSASGLFNEAFRWTASNNTMASLGGLNGALSGPNSYARAVNAAGNVVVGEIYNGADFVAFRWTEDTRMITVADWLASAGISTTGFTSLITASSVSADGDTITGIGNNNSNQTEAYIARVASITSGNNSGANGIVGMHDLANSIAQGYSIHHQMEGLNSLALNGAHHRPLMDIAINDGQSCGWVSGDLGRAWRQANGTLGMAEVGACHDFADQKIRLGVGVGSSFSNLDLANQGKSHITGQYGLLEVDWLIPNTKLLTSLLASYGRYDTDLRRGYAVAGTQPSRGSTDIDAYSLRARLDWLDALQIGQVSITPRIAYTLTRTDIDGFQERGGSAPARFDNQQHTARELRLGATAKYPIGSKTTLLAHVEAVHRLDDRTPGVSGNLNILSVANMDFNLRGNKVSKNWGRIGAEIDYRLGERSRLNASTFVASQGHDADVSAGISYQFFF